VYSSGALSLEYPEIVRLEILGPLVVVGVVVTLVILTAVLGGTPRDIERLSDHLTGSARDVWPSRSSALVLLASASVLLLMLMLMLMLIAIALLW